MGPIKRQFYDQNSRSYNVVISGFVQKMRSWNGGNKIVTNEFVVDDIVFYLQIYPNCKAQGHVGVFLQNNEDHVMVTMM